MVTYWKIIFPLIWPMLIFYLVAQKQIINGVINGAVNSQQKTCEDKKVMEITFDEGRWITAVQCSS